jgi:hypothetical protein
VTSDPQRRSVRIDKWLWAARFFKTRALASKACDLGRIRSNEIEAKPAREAAERKAMQDFAPLPERRPTKRDRRRIIQFRRST